MGAKSDSESNFPINFQPMPKRFMVWDKKYKKFLTAPMEIWQIVMHFRNRYHQLYDDNGNSRYIFFQSTNLFDKDGKEIFEGSILCKGGKNYLVISQDGKYMCASVPQSSLKAMAKYGVVIGHILSNPELLEEETC